MIKTLWNKIQWSLGNRLKVSDCNPYTYYCKRCGQEFNTFGMMDCHCYDRLEEIGSIIDPKCGCHRA
jgi:hypothetical protein